MTIFALMSATQCLNCNTPLQGAYCHGCGQRGNTHRLSLKHFVAHDLVHGLWHLDGSLPRTLKNVALRPGRTAVAYLAGKRAGQFNLVTLMLILIGLNLAITSALYPHGRVVGFGDVKVYSNGQAIAPGEASQGAEDGDEEAAGRRIAAKVQTWMQTNSKWIILGLVPILSVVSLVVFRRARFNYAEHLLINSFFLAGVLLVRLVAISLEWTAERLTRSEGVHFFPFLALAYLAVLYWQAHRARYRLAGWLWRLVVMFLLFLTLFFVVAMAGVILYKLLGGGSSGLNGLIKVSH